ncbi:PREDICTED: deleted in autism protein 1 homolog [Branchiostoma belcheri]|uniref:Deleted in autism protein 1 homolog n=1 Tax=Branchiostoma belcheri TaxID=7741 RepID=A0A6P4ZAP1_BRABE|nr:PREDICTED: deleted in autism protein 1 homolog [Branchiostoma belcheri]
MAVGIIARQRALVLTHDLEISWAETGKCPACFGDTCELLHRGHFQNVHSDRPLKKGAVSIGTVDGKTVIAKILGEEHVWQRFLQEVKQLFVKSERTGVDRRENRSRQGRTRVSRHVTSPQRGSVLLRYFTTKSTTPWPFPKSYGACGRVILVEHAGRTLDTFMDFPWGVRAGIAVQLLQLVDTLRGKDPDWVLFLTDVSFQNFAVDSRGRVRLIDLDDVMVIDRRTVVSHELTEMCNEQCYVDFQNKLFNDPYHCQDILRYTPMMYASICARILSNHLKYPERRNWGESSEANEEQSTEDKVEEPLKGLLHDPPGEINGPLEDALRQCVQETQPGGRLNAVLTLQQLLKLKKT